MRRTCILLLVKISCDCTLCKYALEFHGIVRWMMPCFITNALVDSLVRSSGLFAIPSLWDGWLGFSVQMEGKRCSEFDEVELDWVEEL
jgi:hypothetical protein